MKIIVVDDDKLVALSLKTILESTDDVDVIAMGESGEEAIRLYDEYTPDILLMDIRMDGMTGLDAGVKIREAHPDAKILYLTTFSDDEYIIKALNIGAKGYILKQDYEGIPAALKAVMSGQSVFGDMVREKLPELVATESSDYDFAAHDISEREQHIIEAVAKGLNNKEIAEALYLSEGTVRNYISTLLDKLELRDRTQLAIFYYTEIR